MGFKDEQQQYFESQIQQRVLYIPNLSMFLLDLHKQVLKLPHEMQDPNQNFPVGTKYEDIVKSFCNGVDVAYAMLGPIRKFAETEYPFRDKKQAPPEIAAALAKLSKLEGQSDFIKALDKLEWIYQLLEEADLLNARTIEMVLPDPEDDYANSAKPKVPAPEQPANDRAVGPVEVKDEKPMAKKDLAPAV